MNITAGPIGVVKAFSQVRSDLTAMDANLTNWENHGRTYPDSSVHDTFDRMALDLDNATGDLKEIQPSEKDLLNRLKSDTLNLGFNSGMTDAMSQQRSVFGSGWGRDLDSSIEDSRQALDVAANTTQPAEAQPPSPVQVLKELSDLKAELTRYDANLAQWQYQGRTYPGSFVSRDLKSIAGDLYDARDSVKALFPNEKDLIKSLQGDMIHVAGNSGSTHHMYQHSTTFGSGWDRTLDRSIRDVSRAIDLIGAQQ